MTHYRLDANAEISHYMRVKKLLPLILIVGAPAALTPACKPQGVNMAELKQLQARNAQLRQEIAQMETTIRRAGDDIPDLADQLEARNREVVQAYEALQKLKAQETEVHLRRLELEKRLDDFHANFQAMQKQAVSTTKNNNNQPQP